MRACRVIARTHHARRRGTRILGSRILANQTMGRSRVCRCCVGAGPPAVTAPDESIPYAVRVSTSIGDSM
jgi:hypothetical protein